MLTSHRINRLTAREIIDSRARPTVEAEVHLASGTRGRAAVPAGASTGRHEAKELRDQDPRRYGGQGVLQAIANIQTTIDQHLTGQTLDQFQLDQVLIDWDGSNTKENLGANAILAVSLAFARAAALESDQPLFQYFNTCLNETGPEVTATMSKPMFNILNGGSHADSGLSFQEFMVVPQQESFKEALRCGVEIYQALKQELSDKGYRISVGDEGGFAPALKNNEDALQLISEAAQKIGYRAGDDYLLSLDVAANEFFSGEKYWLAPDRPLSSDEFITELSRLADQYSLYSIEDPLREEDAAGFGRLTQTLGTNTLIIGDDYLVTDPKRIRAAGQDGSVSGVIIKPNQIGTVSETLEAVKTALEFKLTPIVSHRSGETEDVSIAHLAVGLGAPLVKFGAPARGERTAKYNELLRISETLNNSTKQLT